MATPIGHPAGVALEDRDLFPSIRVIQRQMPFSYGGPQLPSR